MWNFGNWVNAVHKKCDTESSSVVEWTIGKFIDLENERGATIRKEPHSFVISVHNGVLISKEGPARIRAKAVNSFVHTTPVQDAGKYQFG